MISILKASFCDEQNLLPLPKNPSFRRATLNMKLAHQAVSEVLSPDVLSVSNPEHMGFVLGSSHGEVSATKDFLKFYADDHPRPFLFQNSLHNSTTGFVATANGIKGPTFTVSQRELSGESSLDLGMTLLETGICNVCIVAGVDVWEPMFDPTLKSIYGEAVTTEGAGAAALLIANPEGQKLLSLPILKTIQSMKITNSEDQGTPAPGFFGGDFIFRVAQDLLKNQIGSHKKYPKPSNFETELRLDNA